MGDAHMSSTRNPIPCPSIREIAQEKERVEDRLAKAWALYEDAVWRIARDAQKRVVNPFLDANPGMKLSCRKGKYELLKDGLRQYPEVVDIDIFDLLEVKVEGYEDALATWMMDYPARKETND